METLEMPARFATRVGERGTGRAWAWPATVAVHALVASGLVVVPLLREDGLPASDTTVARAFFAAPALAPAPPPPPPPAPARPAAPRVAPKAGALSAPVEVPTSLPAEAAPDLGFEGGVPGGVGGGVQGGVVGGVVGGIEAAPPPPPQVVRVGGDVHEPKKVRDVAPAYPLIARRARVQGIVVLECTISPQGRVEGVQVLRGAPMLDEAAVAAVKQWQYTPTLLHGVPVGVVLTVTVNFVLRDGGLP